jgi:hypothetical protein
MTVVDSPRTTMESYLQALLTRGSFADYLSDDVALELAGSGQSAHGRTEVAEMIRYVHEQAFDATAKLKSLVVEGKSAALEARLRGPPYGRVRWHPCHRPPRTPPLQRPLRPHHRRPSVRAAYLRPRRRAGTRIDGLT